MTTIETKYLSPTNFKGARYVASACTSLRIVLNADTSLTDEENHKRVAKALRDKLDWGGCGAMVGGGTMHGMVWVFTRGASRIAPGRYKAESKGGK